MEPDDSQLPRLVVLFKFLTVSCDDKFKVLVALRVLLLVLDPICLLEGLHHLIDLRLEFEGNEDEVLSQLVEEASAALLLESA